MPTDIFNNGVGGVSGLGSVISEPLYTSGPVVFVSSVSGDAANDGLDRNHPVATLAQAITALAAATDGMVVMLSNHREEIAVAVVPPANTLFVGEGLTSGRPDVELTAAAGGAIMFNLAGVTGGSFENIRFRPPSNAAAPGSFTGAYIQSDALHLTIKGCDFEFDQHCDASLVLFQGGADGGRMQDCILTSVETSTAAADAPFTPVFVGSGVEHLTIQGCQFDGGVSGFRDASGNPRAIRTTGPIVAVLVENLTLTRGADFFFTSGSTGRIVGLTTTGSARIQWAA